MAKKKQLIAQLKEGDKVVITKCLPEEPYEGLKGELNNISCGFCSVILDEKSSKKVIGYNLKNNSHWTTQPSFSVDSVQKIKRRKTSTDKISTLEKNLKDLKDDLSKEYAKIDWRLTQLEAKLASDDEVKASKFKIGDTVKIISLPDEFVPDAALGKIGVITGFVKNYPGIKVKFERKDLPYEFTLNWFFNGSDLELVKVPLDVVEKEYLRVVIKPYKDKIAYVIKKEVKNCNGKFYYLKFYLKNDDTFELPLFKTTSNMYKGMDSDVKYHLDELGL